MIRNLRRLSKDSLGFDLNNKKLICKVYFIKNFLIKFKNFFYNLLQASKGFFPGFYRHRKVFFPGLFVIFTTRHAQEFNLRVVIGSKFVFKVAGYH